MHPLLRKSHEQPGVLSAKGRYLSQARGIPAAELALPRWNTETYKLYADAQVAKLDSPGYVFWPRRPCAWRQTTRLGFDAGPKAS
jgi:hypothetical protein